MYILHKILQTDLKCCPTIDFAVKIHFPQNSTCFHIRFKDCYTVTTEDTYIQNLASLLNIFKCSGNSYTKTNY